MVVQSGGLLLNSSLGTCDLKILRGNSEHKMPARNFQTTSFSHSPTQIIATSHELRKGNALISGKSRLVKYYDLARLVKYYDLAGFTDDIEVAVSAKRP